MNLDGVGGIAIPAWLGWVIALGSFGALLTWMILEIRKQPPTPVYVPLPGIPMEMTYSGAVSPEALARAVLLALVALGSSGPWPPVRLRGALSGLRIRVMPMKKWWDGAQWVSGQTIGDLVAVGEDLTALCHEFSHRAGAVIDGNADQQHLTWQARGLMAAQIAYEQALLKQG